MTQKPHHSEHPVFMNSPAQNAMYIQRTFKKLGNKHCHVRMTLWLWSIHGTCEADGKHQTSMQ